MINVMVMLGMLLATDGVPLTALDAGAGQAVPEALATRTPVAGR